MSYFVTGGTGFIGRYLVGKLLAQGQDPRAGAQGLGERSSTRIAEQHGLGPQAAWCRSTATSPSRSSGCRAAQVEGADRQGASTSSTSPRSTTWPPTRNRSRSPNIEGTRHAHRARRRDQGRLLPPHQFDRRGRPVSRACSAKTCSRRPRAWTIRTSAPSTIPKALVRKADARSRAASTGPAIVVGHSKTGEIDKIDGPYYLFTLIKKMRAAAAAVDADARHRGRPHQPRAGRLRRRRDGPHRAQARASTATPSTWSTRSRMRVGEVLNTFARAAHAPEMTMRLDARMFAVRAAAGAQRGAQPAAGQALHRHDAASDLRHPARRC